MSDPTGDFDAATAIVDQLKEMERDRQERVLRWVAESLACAMPSTSARARPAFPLSVEAKNPRSDIQFAAVSPTTTGSFFGPR